MLQMQWPAVATLRNAALAHHDVVLLADHLWLNNLADVLAGFTAIILLHQVMTDQGV